MKEILIDNSTAFRSMKLKELCEYWRIVVVFRCAHRPQGNGIVERNHRTIKRMVARTNGAVEEMVYWYNASPRVEQRVDTIPFNWIYAYMKGLRNENDGRREGDYENVYKVGEIVLVRPSNGNCESNWKSGRVNAVVNEWSVEVDGVPRHLSHVRKAKE